jgi:hypothetical protein
VAREVGKSNAINKIYFGLIVTDFWSTSTDYLFSGWIAR